jgi:hypothetical protein
MRDQPRKNGDEHAHDDEDEPDGEHGPGLDGFEPPRIATIAASRFIVHGGERRERSVDGGRCSLPPSSSPHGIVAGT